MTANYPIHNPHLDGSPFFWKGGSVGVLLSHGYTATPVEVKSLARILHDAGYSVSGPLLPGHATTPEDLNRYRWQQWADTLEVAYQELAGRCETVFVGGESMGAVLALFLASEHPEIAGILTYAPALVVTRQTRIQVRLAAPFMAVSPKTEISVEDQWQGYPVNPLKAAVQLFELQGVVQKRLPRIRQPLLTVTGRLDTAIDHSGVDLLHSRVASTVKQVHWMERSSHVVILDQELDEVGAITLAFMQRVLAQREPS